MAHLARTLAFALLVTAGTAAATPLATEPTPDALRQAAQSRPSVRSPQKGNGSKGKANRRVLEPLREEEGVRVKVPELRDASAGLFL